MAKKNKPYYQEYKRILKSKLKKLNKEMSLDGKLFNDLSSELISLKSLENGITKFPLRSYQRDALYTLHLIYKQAVEICNTPIDIQKKILKTAEYKHINPLLEKDKETKKNIPYIGFEMATGSGKTMIMGSTIYYLNKFHNINNFLIITPSSTEIYKKTIKNFTKGTNETVWNKNVPFKFNLITGDNYKNSKNLFSEEIDANIFIFNIDKFGTNATNTKKEWEGSGWKDKRGNTISLLEFLSQSDLVIITDEAHHTQGRKSKSIINEFKPVAVIEYTATAVENEKNAEKKNQTIVYKYDIKHFLEDKYGKKVRVLALPGQEGKIKGKKTELSYLEKYKLQTFFLVHLVKKKALSSDNKSRNLKPIGFIKVKNEISFSEK